MSFGSSAPNSVTMVSVKNFKQPLSIRIPKRRIGEMHRKVQKNMSLQVAVEESELFSPEELSVLSVGFRTGSDSKAFE